jgi:hypothetical protein
LRRSSRAWRSSPRPRTHGRRARASELALDVAPADLGEGAADVGVVVLDEGTPARARREILGILGLAADAVDDLVDLGVLGDVAQEDLADRPR